MRTALAVVLWTSLGLIVYAHAGYPLLLARWPECDDERRPQPRRPTLPRVTLIVAAHDEEDVIERKLENALALDYPPDRLEVIVASDGSDGPHRRAGPRRPRPAGPAACAVLDLPRRGKVRAQDAAVGRGAGRGARVLGRERALGAPTRCGCWSRPFADPGVGYVCGALALPGAGRLQPGGRLLALRDRRARAREPARLDHGRQRRDLRGAARGLPAARPAHEPRPLVSLQPREARLARGLRAARAWRSSGRCRRSRASSAASGG